MAGVIVRVVTVVGVGFAVAGCSLFLIPQGNHGNTIDPPPAPAVTGTPVPADGDVNVAVDSQLSWAAADDAAAYDVYFGDSLPLGSADLLVEGTTELSVDPGQLNHETVYYWRVDSVNSSDRTTGDTWSFSTIVDTSQPLVTGRWAFDGGVLDDSSDFGVAVSASTGSPAFGGDRFGFSGNGLDTSETYYSAADSETFHDPGPDGWSVAFWAKFEPIEAGDTDARAIITKTTTAGASSGWQVLYTPASNSYTFRFRTTSQTRAHTLPLTTEKAAQWQHVAFTIESTGGTTDVTAYLNGVATDNPTSFPTEDFVPANTPLRIGINGSMAYPAKAQLDDVVLYNHGITLSTVQDLRDDGKRLVFWDPAVDEVRSADLDGSDQQTISDLSGISGSLVRDIEVRPDLGYVYWTNIGNDTIQRAPIGGGSAETVVDLAQSSSYTTLESSPLARGIALNATGSTIYVTDQNYDGILSVAAADGATVGIVQPGGDFTYDDVVYDPRTQSLFYTRLAPSSGDWALGRVDLSGDPVVDAILLETADGREPAVADVDRSEGIVYFVDAAGGTYAYDPDTDTDYAVAPTISALRDGIAVDRTSGSVFVVRDQNSPNLQRANIETGDVTNYPGVSPPTSAVSAAFGVDLLTIR